MLIFLTILQQEPNWVSVVNTLGFPVAVAIFFGFFLFKYVWPWMTGTMDRYVEQNKQQNEQYIESLKSLTDQYQALVREIRAEYKERDSKHSDVVSKREEEYRNLLQQQAQQGIKTLETINANTIAMQSLSSAVEKLKEAAQLEERLANVEKQIEDR